MEHIAVTHFLKGFEKSEEKKVYTSDRINASDLITRGFFNCCKNNKYMSFFIKFYFMHHIRDNSKKKTKLA